MLNMGGSAGSDHAHSDEYLSDESGFASHTLKPLIRQIAAGSGDALANLHRCTVRQLHAVSRAVLGCPRDAEEIVGDVFLYVWTHADRYDEARGSVMAWLAIITRHRSIDRFRARRRSISSDEWKAAVIWEHSDSKTPDRRVAQWEQACALQAALALLPPVRRQMLSLAFLHDFAHEEISRIADLPLGTVKSHIRRGLLCLRAALEETRV